MKTNLLTLFWLILCSYISYGQTSSAQVIQTNNGLAINYSLPAYNISDTSISSVFNTQEMFKYIHVDEYGVTDDIGFPELPQITLDLPISLQPEFD